MNALLLHVGVVLLRGTAQNLSSLGLSVEQDTGVPSTTKTILCVGSQ